MQAEGRSGSGCQRRPAAGSRRKVAAHRRPRLRSTPIPSGGDPPGRKATGRQPDRWVSPPTSAAPSPTTRDVSRRHHPSSRPVAMTRAEQAWREALEPDEDRRRYATTSPRRTGATAPFATGSASSTGAVHGGRGPRLPVRRERARGPATTGAGCPTAGSTREAIHRGPAGPELRPDVRGSGSWASATDAVPLINQPAWDLQRGVRGHGRGIAHPSAVRCSAPADVHGGHGLRGGRPADRPRWTAPVVRFRHRPRRTGSPGTVPAALVVLSRSPCGSQTPGVVEHADAVSGDAHWTSAPSCGLTDDITTRRGPAPASGSRRTSPLGARSRPGRRDHRHYACRRGRYGFGLQLRRRSSPGSTGSCHCGHRGSRRTSPDRRGSGLVTVLDVLPMVQGACHRRARPLGTR